MEDQIIDLLSQLINIESITNNEKEIGDFLAGYLINTGWQVVRQTLLPDEPHFNLFAYRKKNVNPSILFCTHLDTVGPQLPLRIDERNEEVIIKGRGACDAKGQIVAMILAAEQLTDIGLLFTVCEETDQRGIQRANDLGLQPDCIIVGEPTENKMIRLQKGYLHGHIVTTGKKAHSGYPHLGDCALTKLIKIMQDMKELEKEIQGFTINFVIKEGGIGSNVIADHCSATFSARFSTNEKEVQQKLKEISVHSKLTIDSVSPVVQLQTFPEEFETDTVGYVTDIYHFKGHTRKMLYGPGSIRYAHCDNEQITLSEIQKGIEGLIKIARKSIEKQTLQNQEKNIDH